MDNATIKFLHEMILRFGAKSPKFFETIKTILLITTVITGLPQVLIMFGIDLPEAIDFFANKLIAIASLVSLILSSLPVEETAPPIVVIQTETETEKTETETETVSNAVYLPFSNIYALKQ